MSLKRKFEILKQENERKEKEVQIMQNSRHSQSEYEKSCKEQVSLMSKQLSEREKQIQDLQTIISKKDSKIKSFSATQAKFKKQLEIMKDELVFNKSEKEGLARKLSTIEKQDCKSLRKHSKKVQKRAFSNSMKNSTILLSHARRLSSPSPGKGKHKTSKRRIKKRKMSSGTRKSKLFKQGRNALTSETSPFSLMFNQLTPLVSNAKDKNLQMYTQKFRTGQQDLHDAKAKLNNMQKYIGGLKFEISKAKEKYRKMRKLLDLSNTEHTG